jgi:phosphoglycerol transferase MdoB-like AlkP superfamily enzyme
MTKVVYASQEHQAIIDIYINTCIQFVKDIATKNKFNNYLEVVDLVIEYSNGYGQGLKETGNFYDWIMIIPINLSVATSGFFAGIESRNNAATVRAYKVVLEQMLHETVDKINLVEPTNE